jgi:ABC-type Zn2+ transport system substrate-binding protein/surface adhesin
VTKSDLQRWRNVATVCLCFVFLAIRISGVHAHQSFALSGAEGLTASHVEIGFFHFDSGALDHDHHHHDNDDHHADDDAWSDASEHTDLKLDVWADASPLSKLGHAQILATTVLWQIAPISANAISRDDASSALKARPRLRPPSCGPPRITAA